MLPGAQCRRWLAWLAIVGLEPNRSSRDPLPSLSSQIVRYGSCWPFQLRRKCYQDSCCERVDSGAGKKCRAELKLALVTLTCASREIGTAASQRRRSRRNGER